ncbi:MAG: NADH-quinone oxidoreductase subunit NuoG [Anaerolineales bacterium]|nr:Nitrate reductase [Pyrinomonadaceae bacterium]MCC6499475.1 NADH-quinone oxidoreductase subunit NuoG [Anaerolineales bacterium]
MSKQVTLTIDGKSVAVPDGLNVVDAAKMAGIEIPVFCHHPKLEPVGMCRMCLVEIGRPVRDRATGQFVIENGAPKIQFMPKLETACTNKVEEGMVVLTQSAKVADGQRGTLEFLLTSHPLDCPVCDKGGECALQDLTMAHGPGKSRFIFEEKMHLAKMIPLGELIYLDRERCIQCARCIRFQDEIAGDAVLEFEDRGRTMQIISRSEPGFDSIFSGNTTDICPVGALTTTDFRFRARPWELGAAPSICAQCPVGCNITLNTRREAMTNGEIVVKRVMPRQNEEVNEIWICDKGRFAYHYADGKQRLTKPLVRKDKKLARASWDAATKIAAENFLKEKKDFVILASGRLSNEDLFNLKTLADHAGGKAYLYSHMAGGELTALVGVGAGTNFGAMGQGTTIVVVASDLYQEAPVWYLRVKQAKERGATLIVLNPRATKLDKYASFTERYEYGDEAKAVHDLTKNGETAEAVLKASNVVVLYGSEGLGVAGSQSLATACAKLLNENGFAGKSNNGLIGVWERANDQGAWEMGFTVEDDLAKALKGKAVYIVGADPVNDDPKLASALAEAEFVAVQDVMETATTEIADVVLPAQAFTEREGTFTSGERRVQRFYPAVPVTGESKPDFAIAAQIARNMGVILEGMSAVVVFDLLAETVKSFEGLNYARLAEVEAQLPVAGRSDMYYSGTTYANKHGLGAHLSGAATRGEKVSIPRVQKEAVPHPKDNELLAVPVNQLYHRGTTMMTAELLHERIGAASVSLHPDAAARLGVQAGQTVNVSFNGTSGAAVVKLDDSIDEGIALVPRSMGIAIREPVAAKVKA